MLTTFLFGKQVRGEVGYETRVMFASVTSHAQSPKVTLTRKLVAISHIGPR